MTADRFGADLEPLRLSACERAHLTRLLDVRLSEAPAERTLRRAWALCPRHAWALGALDAELHAGNVHATAALAAPLLGRAARMVTSGRLLGTTYVRGRLAARAACLTCEHVRRATPQTAKADIVAFASFGALLGRARVIEWSCPACLDGRGPPCRPHLLSGAPAAPQIGNQLGQLADQLVRLRDTLAADAHRLDAGQATAWIASVGWFSGWGFTALRSDSAGREHDGHVPDTVLEH
jgi:hypothetical protein